MRPNPRSPSVQSRNGPPDSRPFVSGDRDLSVVSVFEAIGAYHAGKIDEKEFNDAVTTCKKWTKGKRTDIQCKRMVIDIIDDNLYKTSKGWFSDWYARTKKEVGK